MTIAQCGGTPTRDTDDVRFPLYDPQFEHDACGVRQHAPLTGSPVASDLFDDGPRPVEGFWLLAPGRPERDVRVNHETAINLKNDTVSTDEVRPARY